MTQRAGLAKFWKNKNVLVTGHTGFKGSWLCFCLNRFGANVTGLSLEPDSSPNLFHLLNGENLCKSIICDIRNFESLSEHSHRLCRSEASLMMVATAAFVGRTTAMYLRSPARHGGSPCQNHRNVSQD